MGTPLKSPESPKPLKYSQGKLRYDLIDPDAINGIAKALTNGQEKGYKKDSWQLVDPQEYVAAYQRHMFKHLRYMTSGRTEDAYDKLSGLLHIDHATTCLTFLRWFAMQDTKISNREKQIETKREANHA